MTEVNKPDCPFEHHTWYRYLDLEEELRYAEPAFGHIVRRIDDPTRGVVVALDAYQPGNALVVFEGANAGETSSVPTEQLYVAFPEALDDATFHAVHDERSLILEYLDSEISRYKGNAVDARVANVLSDIRECIWKGAYRDEW